MSGINKQLLQDLMQNIEARKQTEQRLKATVRGLMWQTCTNCSMKHTCHLHNP